MSTITGYKKDQEGIWIAKDPSAQLVYTMDWSEWLGTGETLATVTYTVQARANDPAPLTRVSSGLTEGNTWSYVELSGGQVGKIYTVTAAITTDAAATDRRYFRVKIENRSL